MNMSQILHVSPFVFMEAPNNIWLIQNLTERYGTSITWNTCQILGCFNDANRGGHMYVEGCGSNNYILPICAVHNGQKDLDCGDAQCSKWIRTKPTAILLGLQESYKTQEKQFFEKIFHPIISTFFGLLIGI